MATFARTKSLSHVAWVFMLALAPSVLGQESTTIKIDWNKVTVVSKTTPTLQVVVNPPLRPGEPLGGGLQGSQGSGRRLRSLRALAALSEAGRGRARAADAQKTSWDFSLIDPMTQDFLAATEGHPTVVNFSTMPAWLFKTDKPVTYPADPNQVAWDYTQGTELRDPERQGTRRLLRRLVSWYVNGGFTDENGERHESGLPLQASGLGSSERGRLRAQRRPSSTPRATTPSSRASRGQPADTKFMGMALAEPSGNPRFFEYFLNPANHKPGIPLDYISYHFYAVPSRRRPSPTGNTPSSTRPTGS